MNKFNQKDIFLNLEGDNWYYRNKEALEKKDLDDDVELGHMEQGRTAEAPGLLGHTLELFVCRMLNECMQFSITC